MFRSLALFACAALALSCSDTGPTAPARVALAPVSVGDLTLRAFRDGGFELVVGTRVLLASARSPVEALAYTESARAIVGSWTFTRANEVAWRPRESAVTRVEDGALVLDVRGDGAQTTLRFRRANAGEVEVSVRSQAPRAWQGQRLRFDCTPEAHFLGFGEQYNDVDHRGRSFRLWVSEQGIGRRGGAAFAGDHTTTYFPVPFFLDPRGFGLAVDTDARVEVDLCAADPREYSVFVAQPEPLTLHLYTGPTVADVMREWTLLQGRSSAPPAWAVEGVWLAVQGGPEPVRRALAEARAADIPVAAIWSQDWLGRREFGGGNVGVRYRWSVDETLYPDLAGLIRELHGQGVRFFGYFNPFLVPEQDLYETAVREGYIARDARGAPYVFPISVLSGGVVDLTNPRAVTWFRGYAGRAIELGMDGWMHDFGEWLPHDAVLADGSDAARAHNRYPTEWQRAARAEFEARRPDGDWVMFSRSGWLRTARVSQVVWAGDQEATWSEDDGLPTVIPAMVSLGMAGVGFVTHDVAGFSGGPSTRELFQRWTELAAFTPVFRTHEGLQRALNWSWNRDDATRAHFARFARVHRALAPRILELARVHRETGMPIVRALALEFPDDPRALGVKDEYLLGDDLLVAPVVTEGATSRSVYLPRGPWYDVWDPGRRHDGPAEVTVSAPVGRPPVFSRAPRTDLMSVR